MNCSASKIYSVAKLLTLVCASTALSAQGQQGVLEFHGVLTSPGCSMNLQNVALLSKQAHINGQACGLTSDTRNPLSQLNIARIREETVLSAKGADINKRLVILTYH
jgi:type 1 fimbria pilin